MALRRAAPERTCAGCGRRAPQRELVRFAAREGVLVTGRHEPGRGAYTCRKLACFERAAMRGTFARVLRQPVRIGPELQRLYTGGPNG
ncbi:MAG: YlxR family protein [Gaiellaceae bacterium]